MEMQDVVTTVSGSPIKVEDIIVHLKVNGAFRNTIYQLIENRVVALKCQEFNIGISDSEFYAHADTKRRLLGLLNATDMNKYCKWHGIVMDQWNEVIRQEILRNKLKDTVISTAQVNHFFAEHKSDFTTACVSRIVCADHPTAQRVYKQLVDEGEDFAALARKVSIEKNTRIAGGYVGNIKYGTLPQPIDQAIFTAQPGSLLGPFVQAGYWAIYKVEEIRTAELDENLKKTIANHLFAQWLQQEAMSIRA
jgi:parvulin-like peptidyl-prolyl isomerase